jgi:hypothetical protein
MKAAGPEETADSPAMMASLQRAGAQRFDPVQFHFLQTLAGRVSAQQFGVQRILEARLAQALLVFSARFAAAQAEARSACDQAAARHPQASAELERLLQGADFTGLQRFVNGLEGGAPRETLAVLVRHAAQAGTGQKGQPGAPSGAARPELKSVQYFRDTWSKLSAGKRVTQALDQAPRNAGPINSHRVVLHSLALMRDISPDYLNRFMSYVDTLLCLEQVDRQTPLMAKAKAEAAKAKPAKSRSVRAR